MTATTNSVGNNAFGGDPFDLQNDGAYRRWRDWKLAGYPDSADALVVPVADTARLRDHEFQAMMQCIRKTNMAIYSVANGASLTTEAFVLFGNRFGLRRLDRHLRAKASGISVLEQTPEKTGTLYIPYTDRPIQWHTDGYYNPAGQRIRTMMLHCVSQAAEGGESFLLDHDVAYIRMRDANPDFIAALSAPDTMTIPENPDADGAVRPAQSGPVFWRDPGSGALGMRYTARTRSILWRDDPLTESAAAFLRQLTDGEDRYIFRHRLTPGQGLVCNNVLHGRSAFRDAPGQRRRLYRARYYDRIAGTSPDAVWPKGDG